MSSFAKKLDTQLSTKTGLEGTAKRNILRKGNHSHSSARKEHATGRAVIDDGSVNPVTGAIDISDPNYDSEDDGGIGFELATRAINKSRKVRSHSDLQVGKSEMTLSGYKDKIKPIVSEYLATGEVGDALLALEQVAAPEYSYEFVKRCINASLDANDRERERVSRLLSIGYPDSFSSNTVGKAFERLFEQADEIQIDCLNARELLSIFLARAVVDEVLPPSFLTDSVVANLGGEIVSHAKLLLSLGPSGVPLERVWGPGDGRPVAEMKLAIDQLLTEYLSSSDLQEACRCIKELNAPEFFHEVVKRAITTVLDKGEEAQQAIGNLFIYLVEADMLTVQQTAKGFVRLHDRLDDLVLDAPDAGQTLGKFTAWAIEENLLPANFAY